MLQWGSGFNQEDSEPLKENNSVVDSEDGLDVTVKSQYTLKHHVNPDWLDKDTRYEKVFFWSQQRKQVWKWTTFDKLLQMSAEEAKILSCSLVWDNRSSVSKW